MSDEESVDEEAKKAPVKEVPIVQDQGNFKHDTGDTYDGFFEARKKDRSCRMHGPGVYTTAEGDRYTGVWDADRLGLSDIVIIEFTDGSRYEGTLKDWSFSGRGKYFYPDGSILISDFAENCPAGKLELEDPNGHKWLAKAEQGFAWFEPVNHYYDMLEATLEVHGMKKRHKTKDKTDIDSSEVSRAALSKSINV